MQYCIKKHFIVPESKDQDDIVNDVRSHSFCFSYSVCSQVVVSNMNNSTCPLTSAAAFLSNGAPSSSIEDKCNETSRQLITAVYPASKDQHEFKSRFEHQEMQRRFPFIACRAVTWCGLCIMEIISKATVKSTAMVFRDAHGNPLPQPEGKGNNLMIVVSDRVLQEAQV